MKLITFAVPCYNSQSYMRKCLDSLINAGEEAEIIIINDGSSDDTAAIADEYAQKFPTIVRAIHKENGGHGSGVNRGLQEATGLYYKVVDSDDWLNPDALKKLLDAIRAMKDDPVDMIVANYVYERVLENVSKVMHYRNVLPVGRRFGWDDTKHFAPSQYLMMHAVTYRTQMARESGVKLPEHTFYVDNVYVYTPLAHVESMLYLDIDLYRYYIGRADQSVMEQTVVRRVDQHILVAQIMLDTHDMRAIKMQNKKRYRCMMNMLVMIVMITCNFLSLSATKESLQKRKDILNYMKDKDRKTYIRIKYLSQNILYLLPGRVGRAIVVAGYRIVQKIFKCN